MPRSGFHPAVARWFASRFARPTEPQRHAWPLIRDGRDVLIAAPTGAGKTFAAFLSAIDVRTGTLAWQDRAFARAQLLYADNKLIILDEDGALGLATVSPEGLKVLARAQILEHRAWTPPTLVGQTIYVRDRRTIAAFDLG